jgi:hypothetical protein
MPTIFSYLIFRLHAVNEYVDICDNCENEADSQFIFKTYWIICRRSILTVGVSVHHYISDY